MKRRDFVKASALAAGSTAFGVEAMAETLTRGRVSPSDQINVGLIGAGSRGKYIAQLFLRIPEVRVTALCDVYEPRFAEGREVTGENTPVFRDSTLR